MGRMASLSSFEPSPLAPRRSAEEQARDRDLGFGSVVSRDSRQRLHHRVARAELLALQGPLHRRIVDALACAVPAMRAARLSPTDSLRTV